MSELLENLEIKWQLLLAQAINFFILLFLLKKFLYKPMLKFLRERKEAIEEGLRKSELAEQKFQKMRGVQAKELAKTRTEAQKIIDEAKKRGEKAKSETLTEGRAQADALFAKAEKDIEQLKNQRLGEAEKEIGRLAIEGMEHLIRAKMPEEKKSALANEAIRHIKTLQ